MSIEVTNVTKKYGDFYALDDVSVSLPTGQLTALLGPSGGGKSTLLRIIAGLDTADHGTVAIEGTNATRLPPQKRNVGFVFQHYAVFKHMTVAKNVAFGLEIRKTPKPEVKRRVDELLELVHLSQFADRLPSQLSGGQRQRMALARALAVEPTVLLLDEPFGALDAKVRKELREWLRRLHDEVHVTTVFVTHDQEEAMEVADEIVVINEGRVEQVGSPDQLYDEPASDFVMGFLGDVTRLGPVRLRPARRRGRGHAGPGRRVPRHHHPHAAGRLRGAAAGRARTRVRGRRGPGVRRTLPQPRALPRPRAGLQGLAHRCGRRRHRAGHDRRLTLRGRNGIVPDVLLANRRIRPAKRQGLSPCASARSLSASACRRKPSATRPGPARRTSGPENSSTVSYVVGPPGGCVSRWCRVPWIRPSFDGRPA